LIFSAVGIQAHISEGAYLYLVLSVILVLFNPSYYHSN